MKYIGVLIVYMFIGEVMAQKPLKEYRARRDFEVTPEPKGKKLKKSQKPIFVIQHHLARSNHYDFRLEINGVLKSWAVPKGPSLDPNQKRLATPTEDHPLEYATFEGVIPEGEYGAGPVMIWDIGTYDNMRSKSLTASYKEGKVEVFLHGKKLEGGYVLIHMKDRKEWLLKKINDEYADARRNIIKSKPKSALTGRTMKEIEEGKKKRKKK
jgi:DNA ligase D-like protein (predicted 3'-phosphoesterase)